MLSANHQNPANSNGVPQDNGAPGGVRLTLHHDVIFR